MTTKRQKAANMIDADLNSIWHKLHAMRDEHGEDRKERPLTKAINSVWDASREVRSLMDKDERNATSWN